MCLAERRSASCIALAAATGALLTTAANAAAVGAAPAQTLSGIEVPAIIPAGPRAPLFQTQSGPPQPDIQYEPSTRKVTIRLSVEDAGGYFIPAVRRENFAIYEDGIRQSNATADVEHPSVTVGLLLESGGRYPSLNETMQQAVTSAASQFLAELMPDDKISIWRYGDTVQQIVDFTDSRESAQRAAATLPPAAVSELNFYDALLVSLNALKSAPGRKALIAVTSEIDTFSHANFAEVLRAARESGVPIYAINLSAVAHWQSSSASIPPPYSKLNWKRAAGQLSVLTQISGGRSYMPESMMDLPPFYDDLMENLRVRYVLAYESNANPESPTPRRVRVELVDPKTQGPLKLLYANKHAVIAQMTAELEYSPASNPAALLNAKQTGN